jgi:hypothetical protein
MTDASVSPGTPREVLASLGALTREVRAAQRATWFPLLIFGVFTLGGILVSRFTFRSYETTCPTPPGSDNSGPQACTMVKQGSMLYWMIGLAVAYTVITIFYVRRARSRGVGTPIRPYVITGLVLAGLAAATALWVTRQGVPAPGENLNFWGLHLEVTSAPAQFLERLSGAAAGIGLPLLVLSWVERSRALLMFALGYLVIELVPVRLGSMGLMGTPWMSLPQLAVPGMYLLLGAYGFARAQRVIGRDAS